ncbi:hypothetical protein [Streptomyces sp. ST2-7A]|uniref:hypothetical protein n=1 Tax=Streptomyces sp. ST2-7A TaxID=2907214 RepID=UPI001F2F8BAF|nr:hypothetical protein [Streptomyces sp. ST2-7A]MCE7079587.1 hypothetical protein [Streptomyces sp. ST2-7A]
MENESDDPERDEAEAAEGQSVEDAAAQADAVSPSFQAIWDGSAGFRAVYADVARAQEFLRQATEPLGTQLLNPSAISR